MSESELAEFVDTAILRQCEMTTASGPWRLSIDLAPTRLRRWWWWSVQRWSELPV